MRNLVFKTALGFVLILAASLQIAAQSPRVPAAEDEHRVDALLRQMDLEEKISVWSPRLMVSNRMSILWL